MIGLILKDFYALKKQRMVYLFLIVFYLIYAVIFKNISMFSSMVTLICVMLPISTFSWDDFCKWDKYALSMPLTAKQIVLSKYLLALIMDMISIMLTIPLTFVMGILTGGVDIGASLVTTFATSGVGIFILAVIMPLMYKFGPEKGRIIMMAVFALPFLGVFILQKYGLPAPDQIIINMLPYLITVVAAAFTVLSYYISVWIYSKKEL